MCLASWHALCVCATLVSGMQSQQGSQDNTLAGT